MQLPDPKGLLYPGGLPIGSPGTNSTIRVVAGDELDARELFERLSTGGTDITPLGYPGRLIELQGGGRIGFRPHSHSGPPTIDVNVPGWKITKVKFV